MNEHIDKLIEYTEMILTDLTGMMAVIEAMKSELEAMRSEQPMIINADEVSKDIQCYMKSFTSGETHASEQFGTTMDHRKSLEGTSITISGGNNGR